MDTSLVSTTTMPRPSARIGAAPGEVCGQESPTKASSKCCAPSAAKKSRCGGEKQQKKSCCSSSKSCKTSDAKSKQSGRRNELSSVSEDCKMGSPAPKPSCCGEKSRQNPLGDAEKCGENSPESAEGCKKSQRKRCAESDAFGTAAQASSCCAAEQKQPECAAVQGSECSSKKCGSGASCGGEQKSRDRAPSPSQSAVPVSPGDRREDIPIAVARVCDACNEDEGVPTVGHEMVQTQIHVRNICCEAEVRLIRCILEPLRGVESVNVNAVTRTLLVTHCPVECCASPTKIVKMLSDANLGAALRSRFDAGDDEEFSRAKCLAGHKKSFLVVAVWALVLLAWILSVGVSMEFEGAILHIAAAALGIFPAVRKAVMSVRHGVIDMNTLMILAVAGALGAEEWAEASLLSALFLSSSLLERFVKDRVAHALDVAIRLRVPRTVSMADGKVSAVADLKVGDVISLRPGEQSPIDGVVNAGEASVTEAAITGEAFPISKKVRDAVTSGSVVLNGYLEVKLTVAPEESSLSQMANFVVEAQMQRSRTQRLVDAFAAYWTPTVLFAVVVLVVVVPSATPEEDYRKWLHIALVLLVLACPCALVLAAPIPTTCAIASAAHHGVLLKSCDVVEDLAKVSLVAVDKTGTLTKGDFQVLDTKGFNGADSEGALHLAAAVESRSAHPLAHAIVTAAVGCSTDRVVLPEVQNFTVVEGAGVQGDVVPESLSVLVGNDKCLKSDADVAQFQDFSSQHQDNAVLCVVVDGALSLGIVVADIVREEALEAVQRLHDLGCRVEMLTGDSEKAALPIAKAVGVDGFHASLLPSEKLRWIVEESNSQDNVHTAMIGDGINDATALAAATVGIAMGASGTALAAKSARMVLMSENLTRVPDAIHIAKATKRTIAFNIGMALTIKLVAVALALTGFLTLWMAVLVDVGSSLLVLCTGLHLLSEKNWERPRDVYHKMMQSSDVEMGL